MDHLEVEDYQKSVKNSFFDHEKKLMSDDLMEVLNQLKHISKTQKVLIFSFLVLFKKLFGVYRQTTVF
jgi:trehalose-6-phosphatase